MAIGTTTRRRLVWAVPATVAAVAAGVVVASTASASSAPPSLPGKTAAQLIADVQKVSVQSLSGTVTQTSDLGLPSLPGAADSASLSPQAFLTGSHTAKVWIDGADNQRVALFGSMTEADVIHHGRDLWTYTSHTNTVTHTTLPADTHHSAPAADASNPATVAQRILKAITPTTVVSVDQNARVAGRPVYTLALAPKSSSSTVSSVAISVDAATSLPLRVQVFAGGSSPAFQLGFSSISFARPAASEFNFHAPAGATVAKTPFGATGFGHGHHHVQHGGLPGGRMPAGADRTGTHGGAHPTVIGSSWTSVVEVKGGTDALGSLGGLAGQATSTTASGDRLLHTALINVLFRKDGTVFAGAVTPSYLEHVAATTR